MRGALYDGLPARRAQDASPVAVSFRGGKTQVLKVRVGGRRPPDWRGYAAAPAIKLSARAIYGLISLRETTASSIPCSSRNSDR